VNGEISTQMPSQTLTQSQLSHNNNQNAQQTNHNNSHNKPQLQQHSSQPHNTLPSNTFAVSIDANKEKKLRNYKLIADPALKKGPAKVYRYDGVVPGVRATTFCQFNH